MEYMVLIYRDETDAPEYGSPEWEQMMAGFLAFNQRLIDGGHWITGGGLQTTPSATTVRLSPEPCPRGWAGRTPRPRSSWAVSTWSRPNPWTTCSNWPRGCRSRAPSKCGR